jgi:hypothetical protein
MIQPTRSPGSLTAKAALVSTVSLGLLAGPVALAAPAQASDYSKHDTCTVTALRPHEDKTKHDRKFVKVDFSFKIYCEKNTKVYFNQKMFQQKGKWYKQIGSMDGWAWVHGTKYISNHEKVWADHGDKAIKVYQTVKIRFKDDSKHGSSWSYDQDTSPTAYIRIW